MSSGPSATLSTWFKIRGINYSISSACATSTHCIGVGLRADRSSASRTSSSPAAARSSTGRCRRCSTPWAPCRRKFNDRPAARQPRLRRGPRRLRHRRRRRDRGAGGHWSAPRRAARRSTARSSATRPTPTATTWSRPSGEGAARCMRLALADGRRAQDRLPQPARHRHAGRRRQGDGGGARRCSATTPPLISLDQVADRPQPGRRRRAGGDLLPADDARRLRRRERQHRHPRPRRSPTCRSCASASTGRSRR